MKSCPKGENEMNYSDNIERVLVSEKDIEQAVDRIVSEIERDYKDSGKKILLVGILKGSVVFMADIMKKLNIPAETDYMKVSSYGSGTTSGEIKLSLSLSKKDVSDYSIIVIEDILDTGNTLSWLLGYLKNEMNAKEVKLCVLFNKPDRRKKEIAIDYEGFVIPDEFIVGYGLDYNEMYRNLPYVGVLKPSVYENN